MSHKHLILAGCAIALACSGDDGPSQPSDGGSTTFTVNVVNNQFDPTGISVPLNSTVNWQWNAGGVEHNVTFQDGSGSGNRTSGTFPRKFEVAGTYPYVCTIHAAQGMSGTVTVSGGTSGGGTGDGGSGGGGGGGGYP